MDEEGIVWIENHVPAVNKKDIKENLLAVIEFAQQTKRPVINIINSITMIEKEARDYGASEEVKKAVSAMALVANGRLSVLVANLFIRLSVPPFPTKLFTSNEDALIWLKKFPG
ncbi:MAG: hypothetical protein OEY93_09170 [Anaerolineae bacterium]|nr:hypothetical protein [Anaerolineae bacterium]